MTDYRCDHGEISHCDKCTWEFEQRQKKAFAIKPKKKKMAKKTKMVTVPDLFLQLNGDVSLVDTSVSPHTVTKLDDQFVVNAVMKAVQDALAQSLKQKGKK